MALLDELLGIGAAGPQVQTPVNDPWSMMALEHLLTGITNTPFSPSGPSPMGTPGFTALNVPKNAGMTVSQGGGVPQLEVPRVQATVPPQAASQFQTTVEPAQAAPQPQNLPAVRQPEAMPQPAPQAANVVPEPSFLDRLGGFSAGYQNGGLLGGILNAVNGVDKATANQNMTARFFQSKGFSPEQTQIIMQNPDLQKALLPMAFGIKGKGAVHVVDGALVDDSGKVLYQGNPAGKLGVGWTTDAQGNPMPMKGGPADPEYLAKAANARKAPPTATEQKAIQEADEDVLNTRSAIGNLKKALGKNNEAYSGPFAKERGYAGSVVGLDAGEATEDVDNLVGTQAISQLKAVFGGMPTEGERKILLELQGSVNQSKKVRADIWDRAIQLANVRLKLYEDRATQMRDKTYYQPGGGTTGQKAGNASAPALGSDPLGLRK